MNSTYPRARGRTPSRNRQWTANGESRRGRRGIVRGRNHPNATLRNDEGSSQVAVQQQREDEDVFGVVDEPDLETQEEREKFYQELVKAREVERRKAIADGKMDDPLVAKRLEDAITIVGTCQHMCPRFERYRRERENNLFEWETIPGTKRVDHRRAVKMYERAAGDKTLPSDLRPPAVLKKTLDYLFHDLLGRAGFSQTYTFIRDRSRAVRNDFTMQHESGPIAIECHDRCARFHILALHFERDKPGFSVALEEQQLMNTLQSLKEFYTEQRPRYTSPNELEMRVYHRLIHIRDQRERHEDLPPHIASHPVFKLTTLFRRHVQAKSAPITKTSSLVVDNEGMRLFAELVGVLTEQGNVVMIYLVACILETLFGKDTIEDIESIRGQLGIRDVIDGTAEGAGGGSSQGDDRDHDFDMDMDGIEEEESGFAHQPAAPAPAVSSGFSSFASSSVPMTNVQNVFGGASTFGGGGARPMSVFGSQQQQADVSNAFGATARPTSVFGSQQADVAVPNPFGIPRAGELVSQTSTSTFLNPMQQQQQQQQALDPKAQVFVSGLFGAVSSGFGSMSSGQSSASTSTGRLGIPALTGPSSASGFAPIQTGQSNAPTSTGRLGIPALIGQSNASGFVPIQTGQSNAMSTGRLDIPTLAGQSNIPTSSGSGVRKSESVSGGFVPISSGQTNTSGFVPISTGQSNAPTSTGRLSIPALAGQSNIPTSSGSAARLNTSGFVPISTGQFNASTSTGRLGIPALTGQSNASGFAPIQTGQSNAPTSTGRLDTPALIGQSNIPTSSVRKSESVSGGFVPMSSGQSNASGFVPISSGQSSGFVPISTGQSNIPTSSGSGVRKSEKGGFVPISSGQSNTSGFVPIQTGQSSAPTSTGRLGIPALTGQSNIPTSSGSVGRKSESVSGGFVPISSGQSNTSGFVPISTGQSNVPTLTGHSNTPTSAVSAINSTASGFVPTSTVSAVHSNTALHAPAPAFSSMNSTTATAPAFPSMNFTATTAPATQQPPPSLHHPPQKPLTPPPLRIDTQSTTRVTTDSNPSGSQVIPNSHMASPTVPPALGRRMPVPLPSTPSASPFHAPPRSSLFSAGETTPVTPTRDRTPFESSQRVPDGVLSPLDVSFSSGATTVPFPVESSSSSTVVASPPSSPPPSMLDYSPRKKTRRGIARQSLLASVLVKRGKGVSAPVPMSPSVPIVTTTTAAAAAPLSSSISATNNVSQLLKRDDKGKGVQVSPSPSLPVVATTTAAVPLSSSTSTAPTHVFPSSSSTLGAEPPSLPTTTVPSMTTNHVSANDERAALAQRHYAQRTISKVWTKWKGHHELNRAWIKAVQNAKEYRARKRMKMVQEEEEMMKRSVGEEEEEEEEEEESDASISPMKKRKRGGMKGKKEVKRKREMKRKREIFDMSEGYRTDAKITKRFKEDRAKSEFIWAPGSYLSIVKKHVQSLLAGREQEEEEEEEEEEGRRRRWDVWLSLNDKSEASAIWIENKFEVPKSGRWIDDENVFEIPVVEGNVEENKEEEQEEVGKYTGLIVFECTPTNLIKDDIEKKYRVLDDCARLRDIVDALSSKRHYALSLLILRWVNEEPQDKDKDKAVVVNDEFLNMVKNYVDASVFSGHGTMEMTTTVNLDQTLSETLQGFDLDVQGRLVKPMTVRGMFGIFEKEVNEFLPTWMDQSWTNGRFDWMFYAHLVYVTVGIMNETSALVSTMLLSSMTTTTKPKPESKSRPRQKRLFPRFDVEGVKNSQTAYEMALQWVSRIRGQPYAERIGLDLQSHVKLDQVFPARTFIQHILELVVVATERHFGVEAKRKYDVPTGELEAALASFEKTMSSEYRGTMEVALKQKRKRELRKPTPTPTPVPSPKPRLKRGRGEDDDGVDNVVEDILSRARAKRLKTIAASQECPIAGDIGPAPAPPPAPTPASYPSSVGEMRSSSRRKTSTMLRAHADSLVRGSTTVSSSPSSSTEPPKKVTVAMLRALTREVKNKYGSTTSSS